MCDPMTIAGIGLAATGATVASKKIINVAGDALKPKIPDMPTPPRPENVDAATSNAAYYQRRRAALAYGREKQTLAGNTAPGKTTLGGA